MNAWTGLLLIVFGVVCGLPIGYGWCSRDERRYRDRANFRCEQLIAANGQLRQERAELNEFLTVVTPESWDAT